MIARISPSKLRGTVAAIPSKSEAHRALICAALTQAPTQIEMGAGSEDIAATIRCLTAFGAHIRETERGLCVEPIAALPVACDADCGESGSTLRFLLGVAGALGIDARFHMRGRLPQRPISPLDRELTRGGCELSRPEPDVLRIRGRLRPGEYELPGDVSSQYISGLLFALPLLGGDSKLRVTGRRESTGYIEMTLASLARFGIRPKRSEESDGSLLFEIAADQRYRSPGTARIGGDWSNAAFWLCADALPGCDVRVTGLDMDSAQGDRRIVEELRALERAGEAEHDPTARDMPTETPTSAMGPNVDPSRDGRLIGKEPRADKTARETVLPGVPAEMGASATGPAVLDAADIPDLVPIIAATACARGQALRVINAGRLRIKESDRLSSVSRTLRALGGNVQESADGLTVAPSPSPRIPSDPCLTCDADAYWTPDHADPAGSPFGCQPVLRGGEVDACGDHRIAMMAAIASCACAGEVIIHGAEAVNKSYPGFWRDFEALGGHVELSTR